MSVKKLRLKSQATVWLVGSSKKLTLPAGSVLAVDSEQNTLGKVLEPTEYEGCVVKLGPEIVRECVDVDTETFRKAYSESLDKCLSLIVDGFDTLPVIDAGTPMHVMRDLGPVSDWVPEKAVLKTWLHHMNIRIPHPSLSVEQAKMPSDKKHLVLVLTHSW